MDFSNITCPSCRKQVTEPINLICNHNLCYRCAEKLLVLDSESFEKKYKVCCPGCRRTTITYDLRHLIISQTEYDQDLFVTTKYLNEKSEARPKSPLAKSNNDIQSLIAKYHQTKKCQTPSVVKDRAWQNYPPCPSHPNSCLKYYCASDKTLVCNECLKQHKDHSLGDIQTYQEVIKSDSQRIKEDLKAKLGDMKKSVAHSNQYKKGLAHQLEGLQTALDHDFGMLKLQIQKKYEQLSRDIREIYSAKLQQQNSYQQLLGESIRTINQLCSNQVGDLNSQLKFYSGCDSKLKGIKTNIQPPLRTTSYVWQKDLEGIQEGLQRFLKLKENSFGHHRQKSGTPSHNTSVVMEIGRKGSACEDDIMRTSHKSKQIRQAIDAKRFKF